MWRTVVAILAAVAASASCGGGRNPSPSPSPSPSPGPEIPISPGQRLAWSQAAPSATAVRSYRFLLYVDGARTALAGASCMAAGADYDCTAAVPQLTLGRHVLELSTMDPASGRESARTQPLAVTQLASTPAGDRDRAPIVIGRGVTAETSDREPQDGFSGSVTCVSGGASACFSMSRIAADVGPVQRVVSLPDGRLIVLRTGGVVHVLPSGLAERIDVDRFRREADIADIGVDPEFLINRLVYLAVVSRAAGGRSAVSIVRMREAGDRLGEAATLAADLPAAADGRPAISIGSDRRIYVALPSADRERSRGGPYDGLVLRLAPDGSAAGYTRMSSPVIAVGSTRPAALTWIDHSRLLLASMAGAHDATLAVVPIEEEGAVWPAPIEPVATTGHDLSTGGVAQIAVRSATGGRPGDLTFFVLGAAPPALYAARFTTAARPALVSIDPLPLGAFEPSAVAVDRNGDVIVAATESGTERHALLRLHAR